LTALYYHPEAYTTSGPRLMGRHAAGESFLRGFLLHSQAPEFWLQVEQPEHARQFEATARALGRSRPTKVVMRGQLGALAAGAGTLYHPGPGIGDAARHRSLHGHGLWRLCGITHTTSSAGAMDALADLLTAPVQPWDAVICTSHAVKDNVQRVLQAQAEYLKDRLGAQRVVLPRMPVIPLGIHTADFVFSGQQRQVARQALGVAEGALVVLFMGRLSFHAKAHPLAMYQALEQAAKRTGKTVVLVECGWHANESIRQSFESAQQAVCPSVRCITLDGREAASRQQAWASADVACSLSDNIQETFGITPIEAMAAGLPLVVSDWDGYKDTVRDGVDGFRVPTLMPPAGLALDLAYRHALELDSYDMYCGQACALVSVDVTAATEAFVRLFESPELRARMGASGRQRAVEVFDWANIMARYEALWQSQDEQRAAASAAIKPLRHPWPARMDPLYAFAAYPSGVLKPDTRLALVDAELHTALQRLAQYAPLSMVRFAQASVLSEAEAQTVLRQLGGGPVTALQLVSECSHLRRKLVYRGLVWLLKLGLVRVDPVQY